MSEDEERDAILVVCGSRRIEDTELVRRVIESSPWAGRASELWHGNAQGVDKLAEAWASEHGRSLGLYAWSAQFYSDPLDRNLQMMESAADADKDAFVIAIVDHESRGTWHAIDCAREFGLDVSVHRVGIDDKQESLFDDIEVGNAGV